MYYYKIFGLTVKSDYRFEEAFEIEKKDIENIDVIIEEKEFIM